MITDSYDILSEPMITPEMVYGKRQKHCDVCIVTFSEKIFNSVLTDFPCAKIAEIGSCTGNVPIYLLNFKGRDIAFFLSPLGAPAAGACVYEASCLTGATSFVMFGSAGCLNRELTAGKMVVPTQAYRDEGLSYHYFPGADYIDVPCASATEQLMNTLRVPCVTGRVWTTDAIYRETRNNVARRKADGCLAVDMELAGVQAVCSFYGLKLYNFLITGDVLDMPEWDVADLGKAHHCVANFRLALEIAALV